MIKLEIKSDFYSKITLNKLKGNGAPLRNQNNVLVTKLPEVTILLMWLCFIFD